MNEVQKYLSADERRAYTVAAVIALAGTHNPSEITTAAIAKHMGVTQGALFRHFPSKDAIWGAVMEWAAGNLLQRIDQAAQGQRSALDAMEAMFLNHVGFVVEHPGIPRMIFGELQRAELTPAKRTVQSLLREYRERLTRQIAAGVASGELQASVDADVAATVFIGMIQGLVMQSLIAGDMQRILREAPRVFAIFRAGIAHG